MRVFIIIKEKFGLTEEQVNYSLKSLKEAKFVESNGIGKNTYYTLAKNNEEYIP